MIPVVTHQQQQQQHRYHSIIDLESCMGLYLYGCPLPVDDS